MALRLTLFRSRGPTLESLEPTLAVWSAPVDNETFGGGLAARWEQLGIRDGAGLELTTETEVESFGGLHTTFVTHSVEVPETLDDIPRVGVRLRIGPDVKSVEWFGRGPHEDVLGSARERPTRAVANRQSRTGPSRTSTHNTAAIA